MDVKKVEALKEAKKKVVDGSLVIWNARLEALAEGRFEKDLINFIGTAVDSIGLTNVCGCPEPGSPVCECSCPPPGDEINSRINEMREQINQLSKTVQILAEKIK